ncbi:MAG: helix-turn-helix transcriptional regulator, partial [Nanoarchaeota archaeon]
MAEEEKYPLFGSFVKGKIQRKGMSYSDVAKEVGIVKETVFKYANGYVVPATTKILRRLARTLDIEKSKLESLIEKDEK